MNALGNICFLAKIPLFCLIFDIFKIHFVS